MYKYMPIIVIYACYLSLCGGIMTKMSIYNDYVNMIIKSKTTSNARISRDKRVLELVYLIYIIGR